MGSRNYGDELVQLDNLISTAARLGFTDEVMYWEAVREELLAEVRDRLSGAR